MNKTKVQFNLVGKDNEDNDEIGVELFFAENGIVISFDDLEDYNYGGPVFIELVDGEIRVSVWSDINQEDPTHQISLAGARKSERKKDES